MIVTPLTVILSTWMSSGSVWMYANVLILVRSAVKREAFVDGHMLQASSACKTRVLEE